MRVEVDFKFIHFTSILLTLVGTWLVAFGLRIREGIDTKFKKELGPSMKDKITPSDVSQHRILFWAGLGLITLAALLEMGTIFFR